MIVEHASSTHMQKLEKTAAGKAVLLYYTKTMSEEGLEGPTLSHELVYFTIFSLYN